MGDMLGTMVRLVRVQEVIHHCSLVVTNFKTTFSFTARKMLHIYISEIILKYIEILSCEICRKYSFPCKIQIFEPYSPRLKESHD